MESIKRCREKYGDRLEILTGVEVTYQTEVVDEIKDFLSTHKFDYVLGSIHLIDHIFFLSPRFAK